MAKKEIKWVINITPYEKLNLKITGFRSQKSLEDFFKIVMKLKRGFYRYYFTVESDGNLAFKDELDTQEFREWSEETRILEGWRRELSAKNEEKYVDFAKNKILNRKRNGK